MILYFIVCLLLATTTLAVQQKRVVTLLGILFYTAHIALLSALIWGTLYSSVSALFFTFDALGTLFFALLTLVSAFVFAHSLSYLKGCNLREYRLYFAFLMLFTAAITGVYFSNNMAVTWIFLEATTLCAAGIVYHHRTAQALEAAWKYVFVCSTGIAIAYLGILLFSTAAAGGSLSYAELSRTAATGNPLYIKTAFLLILCGYSCKMELFPLYTVGVDANFAAPTPAAALISTGLVNAGFVAIYRIYKVVLTTDAADWMRAVLIITGLLSLAVGAFFLRRTNNYKRFLSYSTVENMGIVAIGLGIGGIGVWAAVFHIACHTLIKSSLFLQTAVLHNIYNDYGINRIGDYIRVNKVGAIGCIVGTVVLLAFPPSPLFISELMILKQIIAQSGWWLAAALLVLLCIVIYALCSRMIRLCYQPNQDAVHITPIDRQLSRSALILLLIALGFGLWQPELLCTWIDQIVML
ncbi:MAG: proton-conducting transporter membrane subunit [Alistipes sp.]